MPYTCLYSVHPYWWKRQVSHQLWPSESQHASKKECRRDIHSGFETHEEGHTKFKTGAISGSTKWTLVQTKILKKFKKIWIRTTIQKFNIQYLGRGKTLTIFPTYIHWYLQVCIVPNRTLNMADKHRNHIWKKSMPRKVIGVAWNFEFSC